MKRRGKGIHISGWINLDKPLGMTSYKAVNAVQLAYDAVKAGHGGTLDPLATGVLPIALGDATKTMSYALDGLKSYKFTIKWGEDRTTLDREGEVTAYDDTRPSPTKILSVLPHFVGKVIQVPPKFSALKVNGKRAYEFARANIDVHLKPRVVTIHKLELLEVVGNDSAILAAVCEKGTYIRSLAKDIATMLGALGHVSSLCRTQVGPFDLSRAISLDKLTSLGHSAPPKGILLPIESVLDDIPALDLSDEEAFKICHGQTLSVSRVEKRLLLVDMDQGRVFRAMNGGKLVALTHFEEGEIRPIRVMKF